MSWYQQYWGAVGAASDASKALKAARRLRMTKAEKQAVDAALRRLVKRHGATK